MSQPPSSRSTDHGSREDEYQRNERLLRDFDRDMRYGPWQRITRLARYENAVRQGLNPPKIIGELLRSGKHWAGNPRQAVR